MPQQGPGGETAQTRRDRRLLPRTSQGPEGIDAPAEAAEPLDRPNPGVRRAPAGLDQEPTEQPASPLSRRDPQRHGLRIVGHGMQLLPKLYVPTGPRRCPCRMSGEIPGADRGKNRLRKLSLNENERPRFERKQF